MIPYYSNMLPIAVTTLTARLSRLQGVVTVLPYFSYFARNYIEKENIMNDKEIEELGKVLDEAEKQGLTDKEITSGLVVGAILGGFEVVTK